MTTIRVRCHMLTLELLVYWFIGLFRILVVLSQADTVAELSKAVLNGSVPMERINDMASRVVAAWYQLGQDDKSKFDGEGPNFSSWTNDEMGYVYAGSPDDKDKKVVNKFINVQARFIPH